MQIMFQGCGVFVENFAFITFQNKMFWSVDNKIEIWLKPERYKAENNGTV